MYIFTNSYPANKFYRMEAKISASPPAPIYLERGHAVVGGHLFSPFPQKRVLGDSLMQESSILLPCDRDAQTGSPTIRKVKDVESNPTLTSSYGESDSVISSCMLTSESFYGQTDSSLLRSENECYSVDNVKISPEVLSHNKPDKTPVNESPPPKSRKRNVNWGDRKSIRLSIEYPKSMAADFNPKTLEKVNNSSYFRICFGTEFSDEDDEDDPFTSGGQSMTKESDSTLDIRDKDLSSSIIPSSSNTKAKKPLVRVSFLSATTSELLGVIETEDGMLSPQSLAKFSLPQIQLIINDLLDQISQKNMELMHELPKRDDLILEKEEKQAYLDRVAILSRQQIYNRNPM
ncbi:unnamed protein product [Hymenolepis diminuta]|uniref:Schwannomin interacting protein 1 C-terminal domain-containing protein n=1 Tax=Hymenolepis diminuta TaxID=6216 RepID=A0A564YPJ1_HYMDI|nr:unnamed protein product [Hymenolepis diminuta]